MRCPLSHMLSWSREDWCWQSHELHQARTGARDARTASRLGRAAQIPDPRGREPYNKLGYSVVINESQLAVGAPADCSLSQRGSIVLPRGTALAAAVTPENNHTGLRS